MFPSISSWVLTCISYGTFMTQHLQKTSVCSRVCAYIFLITYFEDMVDLVFFSFLCTPKDNFLMNINKSLLDRMIAQRTGEWSLDSICAVRYKMRVACPHGTLMFIWNPVRISYRAVEPQLLNRAFIQIWRLFNEIQYFFLTVYLSVIKLTVS